MIRVLTQSCPTRRSSYLDMCELGRGRLFLAYEFAAKDVAVAGAVLERDAPMPAAALRDRLRIGARRAGIFARHRDRAIAGEPVRPVLESGFERLLDQQAAKARAVAEELHADFINPKSVV